MCQNSTVESDLNILLDTAWVSLETIFLACVLTGAEHLKVQLRTTQEIKTTMQENETETRACGMTTATNH